jgi:hypothetical protein
MSDLERRRRRISPRWWSDGLLFVLNGEAIGYINEAFLTVNAASIPRSSPSCNHTFFYNHTFSCSHIFSYNHTFTKTIESTFLDRLPSAQNMLAKFLPVGAIALSYLLHYAEAAPGHTLKSASSLTKRANTFVGCDEKQRKKAGQAAADMANLALHAYSEAGTDKYG